MKIKNMNKVLATMLIAISLIPVTSMAAQESAGLCSKIPVVKNLAYDKARVKFMGAGWQPVRTTAPEDVAEMLATPGNTQVLWRRGYHELSETCSGTGVAPCSFLFKDKKGRYLVVQTEGEVDENGDTHGVVVTSANCAEYGFTIESFPDK